MIFRGLFLYLWVLQSHQSGVLGHFAYDASYPPEITLRAGVLHSPPFARIEEDGITGELTYKGFQPDMLKRLQQLASDDGVVLRFEISQSPPQYGAALDLVANDCNTTINPNPKEDCDRFDLIVGDYYVNAERSMRVDFSPAWLRSTISAMKKSATQDIITLDQADQAKAPVCVLSDAYINTVTRGKFPNATYVECANTKECLAMLIQDRCTLYADDELMLRHQHSLNPDLLEVTREKFNHQYIVWPMTFDLPPIVAQLMKKWMYGALADGTMDELYAEYFEKESCPVGRSGETCDDFCHPVHGTANAKRECICESRKWTGDDCSVEVPEETNMIPDTLRVLAYVMLAINFGSILFCGVWLFWQRNSAQVRLSQPFFLALVLLGCAISTSTIFAMEQEDEGDGPVPACMAIPWLYSVGFSITFGTLFAKIRRIYSIFKSAATGGIGRKMAVTFQETVCVVGAVLLIDVFVLVVWTILSPLEWIRNVIIEDQFGAPLESQGYCTSDHWIIFAGIIAFLHMILLGVACYMCYVARNIPTNFSESKYVSLAMISNLQILVVGVPILFIMGGSPQGSFFTRCAIIWMNNLVVVALLFGNLIYGVNYHMEEAEPAAVKAAIGEAIQSFSAAFSAQGRSERFRRGSLQSNETAISPFDAESGHLSLGATNQVQHQQQSQQKRLTWKQSKASDGRQEITLTKSELEEKNTNLRRGEAYRTLDKSEFSVTDTPLPRSFMNSSESTEPCSNANDSWVRAPSNSSLSERSPLQNSVTALSTALSRPQSPNCQPDSDWEDESAGGSYAKADAAPRPEAGSLGTQNTAPRTDVLNDERESWSKIDISNFSELSQNVLELVSGDADTEDEDGWKKPPCFKHNSSRGSLSTSSRLPPASLPEDGPVRMSYAASRINSIRFQNEQACKDKELASLSSSCHCCSAGDGKRRRSLNKSMPQLSTSFLNESKKRQPSDSNQERQARSQRRSSIRKNSGKHPVLT